VNGGVVRLVTFWAVFGVTVTSVGGGVPWSVSATLHEFEPLLSGTLRRGVPASTPHSVTVRDRQWSHYANNGADRNRRPRYARF